MCSVQPPQFLRATAYGHYDGLREAVRLLKFHDTPALAVPLGTMLAEAMLAHADDCNGALTVVPVPAYRSPLRRERSYNQSELLARAAIDVLKRRRPEWHLQLSPHALRRVRRAENQYMLSRSSRRENVRGAFAVSGNVHGLHVLLVDDVYTTGATAAECTAMLLAAGAASVRVAVLARAGREVAVRWHPAPSSRDAPKQVALFT